MIHTKWQIRTSADENELVKVIPRGVTDIIMVCVVHKESWLLRKRSRNKNVEGTSVVPFEWTTIFEKGTTCNYKGSINVTKGTTIVTFKWTEIVHKGNKHCTKGTTVVPFEWTTTLCKGNKDHTKGTTVVPFEWTTT